MWIPQIWRSTGRIARTVEPEEKKCAVRTLGPNLEGDEPPPDWLAKAIRADLPEFAAALDLNQRWRRVKVYEVWRPDDLISWTYRSTGDGEHDKSGCFVQLARYEVIPPVAQPPSPGPAPDRRSMTLSLMVGRPQTVMIRLARCEDCHRLFWGA